MDGVRGRAATGGFTALRTGCFPAESIVTLDPTGLPPKLEDIDAFLDDHAPDAYERLVDGLLRTPQYGEQMARYGHGP